MVAKVLVYRISSEMLRLGDFPPVQCSVTELNCHVMMQQQRKSLTDFRHMAIQLHHGSLKRKKITRPEVFQMRTDTSATKTICPDDQNYFIICYSIDRLLLYEDHKLISELNILNTIQ